MGRFFTWICWNYSRPAATCRGGQARFGRMEPAGPAPPPKLMITNLNAYTPQPTDVAPAPEPVHKPVLNQPPRDSSAQAQVVLSPADAVDAEAGAREHVVFHKKALAQRHPAAARQAPAQQRQAGRQRGSGGARKPGQTEAEHAIEDAGAHLDAVDELLDMLRDDRGEQDAAYLEQMLAEGRTPIEQYRVLFDAMQLVEQQNGGDDEKKQSKQLIKKMMTDLTERDAGVRKALQEPRGEALLAEGLDRALVAGGQAAGAIQASLSPLSLLSSIMRIFTIAQSGKALDSMGAHLTSALRVGWR